MNGPALNPKKLLLARSLSRLRLDRLLMWSQRALAHGQLIRAVNYHGTPARHRDNFRRQLEWYRRHFAPVGLSDLDAFFATGRWPQDKPGLIVSFDDGSLDNFEVARPLLEEFGFIGWFFVPVGFPDTPVEQQAGYVRDHQISDSVEGEETGRRAMSWDEIRQLDRGHVVGCHTWTHCRLGRHIPAEGIEREVVASKRRMEELLGHEVPVFCWVGGEQESYSAEAARVIAGAGYRYAFMTNNCPVRAGTHPLQLQRTNIEANWPLEVVRFQLCGVLDWLYLRKRRRINRLTHTLPA